MSTKQALSKKIVALGVGGIGMSALMAFLLHEGYEVYGHDDEESDLTDHLFRLGMKPLPERLENYDLIYSEAIASSHPHFQSFSSEAVSKWTYFQALGLWSKGKKVIAIAGSHGKTTTTALLAHAMMALGEDPSVILGSKSASLDGHNYRIGKSEFLVVEACEYRNNFLSLHPEYLLITNIDWDHRDFFETEEAYLKAFETLKGQSKTIFQFEEEEYKGPLKMIGAHNRVNAFMVWHFLKEVFSASSVVLQEALASFQGTWRRQEYLGEKNGALIYSDYGHHPLEVTKTLEAFREAFPEHRITLIYQSHQYQRLFDFQNELVEAWQKADELVLMETYACRDKEELIQPAFHEELIARLKAKAFRARYYPWNERASYPMQAQSQKEIFLFMGAGTIHQFALEKLGE